MFNVADRYVDFLKEIRSMASTENGGNALERAGALPSNRQMSSYNGNRKRKYSNDRADIGYRGRNDYKRHRNSDNFQRHRKPRVSYPTDPNERIRHLLITFGEGNPNEARFKDVRDFATVLLNDSLSIYELISTSFVKCVENFTLKSSLYASLLFVSATKADGNTFVKHILDSFSTRVRELCSSKLDTTSLMNLKLLLTFGTHCANLGLITFESIFECFQQLLDKENGCFLIIVAQVLPALTFFSKKLLDLSEFVSEAVVDAMEKLEKKLCDQYKRFLKVNFETLKESLNNCSPFEDVSTLLESESSAGLNSIKKAFEECEIDFDSEVIDFLVAEKLVSDKSSDDATLLVASYIHKIVGLGKVILLDLISSKLEKEAMNIKLSTQRCYYVDHESFVSFTSHDHLEDIKPIQLENITQSKLMDVDDEVKHESEGEKFDLVLSICPYLIDLNVVKRASLLYEAKVRKGRSEEELPLQGVELAGKELVKVSEREGLIAAGQVLDLMILYRSRVFEYATELFKSCEESSSSSLPMMYNTAHLLQNIGAFQSFLHPSYDIQLSAGRAITQMANMYLTRKPENQKKENDFSAVFDDVLDAFMIVLPSLRGESSDYAQNLFSFVIFQVYVASNVNYTHAMSKESFNYIKFAWERWNSLATVDLATCDNPKLVVRRQFIDSLLSNFVGWSDRESLESILPKELGQILPSSKVISTDFLEESEQKLSEELIKLIKSKPTNEDVRGWLADASRKELMQSLSKETLTNVVIETACLVGKASLTHLATSFKRIFEILIHLKSLFSDDKSYQEAILNVIISSLVERCNDSSRASFAIKHLFFDLEILDLKLVLQVFLPKLDDKNHFYLSFVEEMLKHAQRVQEKEMVSSVHESLKNSVTSSDAAKMLLRKYNSIFITMEDSV